MEFTQIVEQRYAVKQFSDKKIDLILINKLLDMIRLAPSSFNIQPWKVIVITSPELKEKLFPASWNQPQIKSCSHLLVFCANTDIRGNIHRLEKLILAAGASPESIHGYVQMMTDFEKGLTEEQKLSWAQRQAYIALGNALNGATALGFASCPMEGFDPPAYAKILHLPKHLVPTALCALGYATDKTKPKLRFPKEEMVEIRS